MNLPNGFFYTARICWRPFVQECLLRLSKIYQIVIFTASQPEYADPIIDLMDTAGVVAMRLYRDQCVNWGGMYVKDLTVVSNRSLREMVLVDNSVHSFSF